MNTTRIRIAGVTLGLAVGLLFCGCATMKRLFVWTHDSIDELLTNAPPVVVTNPPSGTIASPIVGNHGTPRLVRSPDGGDTWEQYEDGYWHKPGVPSGFIHNMHVYSLPGIGIVCQNAGGRNCGREAIVDVQCRVVARADMLLEDGGVWAQGPDKTEWTVVLSNGFTVTFTHGHSSDVMSRATVRDTQTGKRGDFGCNGFRTSSGRGYDTVKDASGREWPTGIRMVKPGLEAQR
jgi:hypothetical protein